MLRVLTASAILLTLVGGVALAQRARAIVDCGQSFSEATRKIGSMKASGAQRAALSRMALSGYDHCMAGDRFNAATFFEMLERGG